MRRESELSPKTMHGTFTTKKDSECAYSRLHDRTENALLVILCHHFFLTRLAEILKLKSEDSSERTRAGRHTAQINNGVDKKHKGT